MSRAGVRPASAQVDAPPADMAGDGLERLVHLATAARPAGGGQHGDVLAMVVVTGLPRDGVLQAATTLANAQDTNIAFVTGG
jgi:hypothetical protein